LRIYTGEKINFCTICERAFFESGMFEIVTCWFIQDKTLLLFYLNQETP